MQNTKAKMKSKQTMLEDKNNDILETGIYSKKIKIKIYHCPLEVTNTCGE
jgi:hypothetical protein